MSDPEKTSRELTTMKGALFALAGVSLLLLTETLRQEKLDRPLMIALYCFVISMPLLVGHAIGLDALKESALANPSSAVLQFVIGQWLSSYIAVGGIVSFLWHFSPWLGLSFIGAVAVAVVVFISFQHVAAKSATPKPPDAPPPIDESKLTSNRS